MFGRRKPLPVDEDPAVAEVEAILENATSPASRSHLARVHRISAESALWICACITEHDSPTWLICDLPDSGFAWRRLPDGAETDRFVTADRSAGGHAVPSEVLRWLRGEADDPWSGGDGSGDQTVLATLLHAARRG